MPERRLRLYLVCYDIANPKRLGRLHRFVQDFAVMAQYSVYLAWLTPERLEALGSGILERIDPRVDDVRIYPLPENISVDVLGRGAAPKGVYFFEGDGPWSTIGRFLDPANEAA